VTQDLLSRATTVADPRAAAALVDPASQAMILAFAGAPRSIAQVAREREYDLKRLHHHVLRFCRLGLLEVAEVRARAGRPVKLYRTNGEAFFVPHAATPELATEPLSRDLRAGLLAAARRPGKGYLVYADADGVPRAEPARGAGPPEAAEMWRILRLAPEEMAALSAELDALLTRYMRSSGDRGRAYIVHAAIAPHLEAPAEASPDPAWPVRATVRLAR
jgi:hypothetical protein